jgi:hypothetical protein
MAHEDQMTLEQVYQEYLATPSYVERFKDGREAWEDITPQEPGATHIEPSECALIALSGIPIE